MSNMYLKNHSSNIENKTLENLKIIPLPKPRTMYYEKYYCVILEILV